MITNTSTYKPSDSFFVESIKSHNSYVNKMFSNLKSVGTEFMYLVSLLRASKSIVGDASSVLYVYTLENSPTFYVFDSLDFKIVYAEDYSYQYFFNKKTGMVFRCGKTIAEDPTMCNLGPEILDLEISINGCPRINGKNCKFCYKNNTNAAPYNMTLETFESLMSKFPKNLSQIAFGITGTQTNPDFIKILESCKTKYGIIPNYTMSGVDLTDEILEATIKYCGAVAISCYEGAKEVCYKTIERIHRASEGFHTNMHIVLAKSTFNHVLDVLNDVKDGKVIGLRHIVFLRIKPVGRAATFDTKITSEMLDTIISFCEENNIGFGFDSCSATDVIKYYKSKNRDDMVKYCEPCESSKFSSYINVHGMYWHCSFCENLNGYSGINVLECDNFNTAWLGDSMEQFRNPTTRASESCQAFNL